MRENLNVLIFFLAVLLVAVGLKFIPSLSFLGLILLLAIVPAIMLRFQSFFSKKTTILGIFIAGLIANLLLGSALLYLVKEIDLVSILASLLPITLIVFPAIFASSFLLSAGVSRREIFAFYFWFLISAGLAILFLLPTGRAESVGFAHNLPAELRFIPLVTIYLEFSLISSAFCFVFRKIKAFLVFLPMPIVLGYALFFSI
ncbi:MAG: hypothetical protein QXP56_07495 [Archaeoglobaceae archaeon]